MIFPCESYTNCLFIFSSIGCGNADIVILLEKSGSSQNSESWKNSKMFVSNLVNALLYIDDVHLGLVVYDSSATNLLYLSSSSKRDVKRQLDAVFGDGATSTTRGIQTVVRDQFQAYRGDRPTVKVCNLLSLMRLLQCTFNAFSH